MINVSETDGEYSRPDFVCPHCGQKYIVEGWDTEYGDPLPGEQYFKCRNTPCGKSFKIMVDVSVTYSAYK